MDREDGRMKDSDGREGSEGRGGLWGRDGRGGLQGREGRGGLWGIRAGVWIEGEGWFMELCCCCLEWW